ncbi:MAG: ABC transporter ATP-binding protein [Leucobacter sp.]
MSGAGLSVVSLSHSFGGRERTLFGAARSGTPVLVDVSLEVPPGTLTAIVGPSGCGKSTLLRALAGLTRPDSGTATLDGEPILGTTGRIAYHPQRDAMLPWLRALDNATLGAETCGVSRAEARGRALDLLDRFGLADHADAWPDELSGGMRQRVALLRTFLMPQRMLAFDEPFGALDALTRRELQLWLLGTVTLDQRATLLVTHDVEEALLLADEVVVLGGRPATVVHVEQRPSAEERLREHTDGDNREALHRVLAALGM